MRWTTGLESLPMQVVALVATFIAASVSYRVVELPLRHNAMLQRFRPALRIALFVLLIVVGREVTQRVFWRSNSISLSIVSRNERDWHADTRMALPDAQHRVCAVDIEVTSFGGGKVTTYHPQRCRGVFSTAKLTVLGDSHALAYLPMFEELSAEDAVMVSVYSFPGCPYLNLLSPMTKAQPPDCLAFLQAASLRVLRTGAVGDALFLPSLRQWRFGDQWASFADRNLDTLTNGSQATNDIQRAVEEAESWLRPFSDKGIAIVFAAPPPMFRSPPFRCSDWFNAGNPICRGGLTQPRSYLESLRAPIVEAMEHVATELPGVQIWDPFPILCPTDKCTPFRDGRPLFFDGDHLSGYGNWVVYPSFRAAINKSMGSRTP
jgi:hypothetical protein